MSVVIRREYMVNQATPSTPTRLGQKIHLMFFRAQPLSLLDLLIIAGVVILAILFGMLFYEFVHAPYEDALILMRYSENLGHGYGIVWNIGEAPVDGATDFLFMVLLAGAVKLGFNIFTSVLVIGFISHLATIALLYVMVIDLWKAPRIVALLSTFLVAFGPGLGYVDAYFGTPFFGFWGLLTGYFAIKYATAGEKPVHAVLFAVSGLIAGLTRPDGVLLAGLMMLALVFYLGVRRSFRIGAVFALIFLVFGGGYFLWRWNYFGYPLPNPYYKKGDGGLYFVHLALSILTVFKWTFPFNLAYFFGMRSRAGLKRTIFLLIPIVGFTVMWVLTSQEGNYLYRYQYVVLLLVALTWYAPLQGLATEWKLEERVSKQKRDAILLTAAFCVSVFAFIVFTGDVRVGVHHTDGRYEEAAILSEYADKGYTMAVSEAGALPFYSRWRSVDTWGLNDQWIAHNGVVTPEYLDQWDPEVLMFHSFFSEASLELGQDGASNAFQRHWNEMAYVLHQYAIDRGYILVADYGVSIFDTYYYYVKRDFPDSQEIINAIQDMTYREWETGEPSFNYAEIVS